MLVDAMTMRRVLRRRRSTPSSPSPGQTRELHADILSDLAAALAGSPGIAPTANLDPERRFPSMFEPIRGSAFDIAGQGIANPIGMFWSAVLILEHLGEPTAAARRDRAGDGGPGAAHTGSRGQVDDAAGDGSDCGG